MSGTGTARGRVLGDRFAVVPQWLIDAEVSDRAVRLYAVLQRFETGANLPSRRALARLLHQSDPDIVEQAITELARVHAVRLEKSDPNDGHAGAVFRLCPTRPAAADESPPSREAPSRRQLDAMARDLLEAGGVRVDLQLRARQQLASEGLPVTRTAVISRAHDLLRRSVQTRPDTADRTAGLSPK